MINKYIKELLKEHNRVIVPDLGAFLYKGESSTTMYFNEFLRFNDGLLLNYIAEVENIDKIEAAKQIKSYVEEANKNLQAKKKVVIKDIGYLYLDDNDKIQLQPDVSGIQTEENKHEPFTIEDSIISKTEDTIQTPEKPEEDTLSQTPPTKLLDFSEPKAEQIIQERKDETSRPVVQAPPPTKVKPATPATGKKITTTAPKAKSNRTILWIASIIVLIIITLLYLFILKPLYQTKTGEKKPVITNTSPDTTTVNINTKRDSTQNKVQVNTGQKAIPVTSPGQKKYYIVVGCFIQENNADKIVQDLRNKGFSPEKFAKIEQMYFVSIASFGNKASAEKQLRELKSKGYEQIWIKYY